MNRRSFLAQVAALAVAALLPRRRDEAVTPTTPSLERATLEAWSPKRRDGTSEVLTEAKLRAMIERIEREFAKTHRSYWTFGTLPRSS